MDFRGIFDHGVIRPTEPVALPEGTEVECRRVSAPNGTHTGGGGADRFWAAKSVEELAHEQRTLPGTSASDLRGDWPAEESIDDFLDAVRKERR